MGVPLSPRLGWQVQAVAVAFLFLILLSRLPLMTSSFLISSFLICLLMALFREDPTRGNPWVDLPMWGLSLEPMATTRKPPAGPHLDDWYPVGPPLRLLLLPI